MFSKWLVHVYYNSGRTLSLSLISLTALRVRAAEGSIPSQSGGGAILGGGGVWGGVSRRLKGVERIQHIQHIQPILHWIQHVPCTYSTHETHNPGSPPGNRACWGIMKNDEVPFFRAIPWIPLTFHLIFLRKHGYQHRISTIKWTCSNWLVNQLNILQNSKSNEMLL